MLHPSYTDLMEVVNSDVVEGEQPVVQSRYSIVIATAKRARQLIAGADATVDDTNKKPLSIAVEEVYKGKVKIMGVDDVDDDDEKLYEMNGDVFEVALEDDEEDIFEDEKDIEEDEDAEEDYED